MSGYKSMLPMKYLGGVVASLLIVAACAPASPPAQKAEAPKAEAPKTEAAAPKTDAAAKTDAAPKAEAAKPAAPAAGAPPVNRLIMSLVPPQRETNDIRVTGNTDLWAIRPMYE